MSGVLAAIICRHTALADILQGAPIRDVVRSPERKRYGDNHKYLLSTPRTMHVREPVRIAGNETTAAQI